MAQEIKRNNMLNNVQSDSSGKSAASTLGGKILILLTVLLLNTAPDTRCQSVLTLELGTTMGVLTGTDLCANTINGSGSLYGSGTICGVVLAIEPIASNELPTNFDMLQNYPNPFNPSTVIKYQLPKVNYVSIKLYDPLGRVAGVLYEGDQQAGYYQVKVDGTNLASGIYFCRISAGDPSSGSGKDFTKVIKMLLIK
jgi:hypothetical protein